MTEFILNDRIVRVDLPDGTPLLEVIRRTFHLTGMKLACGEGECGACTVLVGALDVHGVKYHSVTSCITPLINVHGKHVVTIEGINQEQLTPVQQAMVDCNGTQCGFCTPGFIVSMTGALLNGARLTTDDIVAATDGNICRCTGYHSIQRAARLLARRFQDPESHTLDQLIEHGVLPDYFASIDQQLARLGEPTDGNGKPGDVYVGGGTDLYVQRPQGMPGARVIPMAMSDTLHGISISNGHCSIGAAETMASLQHSPVLHGLFPGIHDYFAPIGSTQIRNMATVAGNLVNASPIGDMTIMLLALYATVVLRKEDAVREVALHSFYQGYKELDKAADEHVETIHFPVPTPDTQFHFVRVCKREYLDVASVNAACSMAMTASGEITDIHLAIGGVAAVPLYLRETRSALMGRTCTSEAIVDAEKVLQSEIAPISDIRGSADYKRLLARQQFFTLMENVSQGRLAMHQMLEL